MAQYTYNPTFSEIPLSSFLAPINAIKELFDARRKEYNDLNETYSKLIAAGDLDIRDYLSPFEQSRASMANYIAGNRFNQSDMLSLAESMRNAWLDRGLKAEVAMENYYKYKDLLAKDPTNIYRTFSMKNFLENPDFTPYSVSGDRLKKESMDALAQLNDLFELQIKITPWNSDYNVVETFKGIPYDLKQKVINDVMTDIKSGKEEHNNSKYYSFIKDAFNKVIQANLTDDIKNDSELFDKALNYIADGAITLKYDNNKTIINRPKPPSIDPDKGNPTYNQNGLFWKATADPTGEEVFKYIAFKLVDGRNVIDLYQTALNLGITKELLKPMIKTIKVDGKNAFYVPSWNAISGTKINHKVYEKFKEDFDKLSTDSFTQAYFTKDKKRKIIDEGMKYLYAPSGITNDNDDILDLFADYALLSSNVNNKTNIAGQESITTAVTSDVARSILANRTGVISVNGEQEDINVARSYANSDDNTYQLRTYNNGQLAIIVTDNKTGELSFIGPFQNINLVNDFNTATQKAENNTYPIMNSDGKTYKNMKYEDIVEESRTTQDSDRRKQLYEVLLLIRGNLYNDYIVKMINDAHVSADKIKANEIK